MRRRVINPPVAFEGVNVTPLIDVVMVLIVFFLIVGKLANEQASGVRPPSSAFGRADEPAGTVVVNVLAREGSAPARVVINAQELRGEEAIASAIRARASAILQRVSGGALPTAAQGSASPGAPAAGAPATSIGDVPVQVRADRSLAFGDVEPVLRAARAAGATGVRLVTERGTVGTPGTSGSPGPGATP